MPFINAKTNISLSRKQRENAKADLGQAISLIPGKSEQWLMVNFEGSCPVYFSGDTLEPGAMVEIQLLREQDPQALEQMTAKTTEIISRDFSIKPERIYISYTICTAWGYNGSNL